MPNSTIINVELDNVVYRNAEFKDDLLTFGGAGTEVEGTILARDSVSEKLIPFVDGGTTNEDGIPKAVLTFDVEAAGAGDEAVRVLISGEVRIEKLVIKAGGSVTDVIQDLLRDFSIIPVSVDDLTIQDNQ